MKAVEKRAVKAVEPWTERCGQSRGGQSGEGRGQSDQSRGESGERRGQSDESRERAVKAVEP